MIRYTLLMCTLTLCNTACGSQKSASPGGHTSHPSRSSQDLASIDTTHDRTALNDPDLSQVADVSFDGNHANGTLPSGRTFIAQKDSGTVTLIVDNQHPPIKIIVRTDSPLFNRLRARDATLHTHDIPLP